MSQTDAFAQFATYRAKPVLAVQVTAENAQLLAELDGITYEPENDLEEMSFDVRMEANYRQGIGFGDWIIQTSTPGLWKVGRTEDDKSGEWINFAKDYEPV